MAKKKAAKKAAAKKPVIKRLPPTPDSFDIKKIMQTMREEQSAREEEAKVILGELAPKLFLNSVAKVYVEYDGIGDSGDIEYVSYRDINDESVKSGLDDAEEKKLRNAVWPFIPSGFENNDGGFGNIEIDLKTKAAVCNHSQRYTETTDSSREFTF